MDNYHVMQKQLFIRLNGKDTEIIHQIENMPAVTEGRYFLIQANFAKTLADSMNAMIRILLYCFVIMILYQKNRLFPAIFGFHDIIFR